MSDLIDRQPSQKYDSNTLKALDCVSRKMAIGEFEKELSAKYNRREFAIGFVGIKRILESLPSAQPEIIRCKDCKYRGTNECKHFFALVVSKDNDFCSYAERRTDADA